MSRLDCFVVTQPGLEAVTVGELERLGVTRVRVTVGGVGCSLTMSQLYRANLWLRTATRVLVRVGRFRATDFRSLEEGLRRLDLAAWIERGTPAHLSVASSRSALYHTGAVEERVREELGLVAPADGDPTGTAGVWVRVDRDGVVVSVDSSGDALHRRGWRIDAGRAPVRETLAAALVLWSGWNGRVPLLDPCCGAGTVAIEAALVAARRAPGRHRRFAFEAFPSFDAAAWQRALAGADADVVDPAAVIAGSDIDPAMVALTEANAVRAGVAVAVHEADVTSLASACRSDPGSWAARVLAGGRGFVVTNPPYGRRLTAGDPGLAGVYAAIGQLAPPAARLAVLAPRRAPTSAFGHAWADQVVLRNGGLPVRMLRSR